MRRLTPALGAALALGVAGAALATSPRAKLDRFVCQHPADPSSRAISVRAVMRAQPYASRMELRFQLLFTPAGSASARSLQGGDLGRWRHPSHPSTLGQRPDDVWRVTKTVTNLVNPGTYYFRVAFRWTDEQSGQRIRSTLMSPDCTEPRS